jgi:hypothetical protein
LMSLQNSRAIEIATWLARLVAKTRDCTQKHDW